MKTKQPRIGTEDHGLRQTNAQRLKSEDESLWHLIRAIPRKSVVAFVFHQRKSAVGIRTTALSGKGSIQ
jgi:hypothetical protein